MTCPHRQFSTACTMGLPRQLAVIVERHLHGDGDVRVDEISQPTEPLIGHAGLDEAQEQVLAHGFHLVVRSMRRS